MIRSIWLACLLVVALSAAEVRVVATVPVVADLVRQVAGDRVTVGVIIPFGADHHVRQPTPGDAQLLAQAKLVIANGLGFEPWLPGLIAAAGWRGTVVVASAGIEPPAGVHAHHDHDDHDHSCAGDPHAFQDVRNAQRYVRTITDALIAIDGDGATIYRARAELVLARLAVLDGWVRRQVAVIPAERRVLATPHDGLGWYAAAYGFELLAVEGSAAGQEADPQRLEALAKRLRDSGVRTVFTEDGHAPGVLANLARAAGAGVAGPLATCGPGVGQDYDAMIVANTLSITAGLR